MKLSGRKLTVKMIKMSGLLGFVVAVLAVPTAKASIIWSAPVNISGATDVQTNGTLSYAYSFGSQEVVNGITFSTFSSPGNSTTVTNGNLTLSTTSGGNNISSSNVFGPGTLTGTYGALLSSGDYAFAAGSTAQPLDVTLGNLTVGASYQVEIWVNDIRSGETSRSETVGPTTLQFQTGTGNGQYETGTFVASSSSQTFVIQGSDSVHPFSASQLNAIELLQTTPEPATFGLTGGILALSSLLLRRRSRATRKS
jgi:hypothetical protein